MDLLKKGDKVFLPKFGQCEITAVYHQESVTLRGIRWYDVWLWAIKHPIRAFKFYFVN